MQMNLAVKIAREAAAASKNKPKATTGKKKQSLSSKARLVNTEGTSKRKKVSPEPSEQAAEQPIAYLPKTPVKVQKEVEAAAPSIDLQQAILWSEILGEPRCRSKYRRTGRRYGN